MNKYATISEAEEAIKKAFGLLEESGVPYEVCQSMARRHLDDLLTASLIEQDTHDNLLLDLQHDGIIKRES